MYTRISLFILFLGIATASPAHEIQVASIGQGPYDVSPSGAMDNTSSGLDTEPQPPVTAIQPLVPSQPIPDRGNTEVKTNPIGTPPAPHCQQGA